jgi:rubrerythrin
MDSPKVLELKAQAEILKQAIEREKASYEFYVQASKSTKKKYEKEVYDRLAQEEVVQRDDLLRQLEEMEALIEVEAAIAEGENKTGDEEE